MKKFLLKLFVKSNGSHFSFGKADGDSAGTTEQLRAEHQMEWVGRMNNIRDYVTEIIHAELIFAD